MKIQWDGTHSGNMFHDDLYVLYIDYSIDFTLQFIQADSLHRTSV